MDRVIYDLIEDQLRSIYRAVTGSDAPVDETAGATPAGPVSDVDVERRFADVEATVRAVPGIAERIPPFAFTPAVDVFEEGNELVVEVAVPGLEDEELEVGVIDGSLWVSGVRRGEPAGNGRRYVHAEIPRGPFRRVVALPFPVTGEPQVTTYGGLARVALRRQADGVQPDEGKTETQAKRRPRPRAAAKRASKR